MGIVVYSLLWVMQDFYHQPYSIDDYVDGIQLYMVGTEHA